MIETLTDEQKVTLHLVLTELEARKKTIFRHLFPTTDTPLLTDTFPTGHKLVEGMDVIHSRYNYPKALDFFKAGKTHKQRLFCAGNRTGKTVSGAFEVVCHATGLYPDWWEGHRFTTCNDWWVVGVTQETVIEILQPLLLGPVGAFGTGLIPRECLDFETLKDAKKAKTPVGSFRVKHQNGTYSTISFKSYEQGRASFQGTALSIFLDEEPPLDIYAECLTRTATGGNILLMTFTPLMGISDVVKSFFPDGNIYAEGDVGDGRWVTRAGWDDIKHLDEDVKKQLLASYPPYQRDARRLGIPSLGSGAIFPVEESTFVIPPFEIPKHWSRGYGLDVGRSTGAVWLAHDRETNILYAYSEYFNSQDGALPSTHAASIAARGKWIQGAIDTASRGRSSTDGENLYQMYSDLGLNLVNADKAVEAGLLEMLELLCTGRLKVFSTCTQLLKEFRGYQRDEKGRIVKKNDHLMDAWRYAVKTRDKIMQTEAEWIARNTMDTSPPLFVPYASSDSWAI